MTLRNSTTRYGIPAQFFHWVTVLLLVAAFGLGLSMVGMDFSPQKLKLYSWHKWVGITVLLVTTIRLCWRLVNPVPSLPPNTPRWQDLAARASHGALYVLLFAQPIVGWVMSSALGAPVVYLKLIRLPDLVGVNEALGDGLKWVHWGLAWTMVAVVAVHVAAALYHHFHLRDDVLKRMLP